MNIHYIKDKELLEKLLEELNNKFNILKEENINQNDYKNFCEYKIKIDEKWKKMEEIGVQILKTTNLLEKLKRR